MSNLPSAVSWITRSIGYTIALIIILAILVSAGRGRVAGNSVQCIEEVRKPAVAEQSALANAKAFGACLERKNGFLENMMTGATLKMLRALPNAPCKYVGRWKSSKTASGFEINLHGNGEFSARPWSEREFTEVIAGSWAVYENKLVWLYKEGVVWPPDVNRMEITSPESFTLTEMNGSKTNFLRFEKLPPDNCSP